MLLLDTNVVSELRRRDKANANVLAWANGVNSGDLYLSAITILEIELGMLLKARTDPAAGNVLKTWITEKVLPSFRGRILPVDEEVAMRCAALNVPNRKSERDALIAATALKHNLTIVTRNVDDFQGTGTALLNPWL
jgi:predicted nucleic acid-binding protein